MSREYNTYHAATTSSGRRSLKSILTIFPASYNAGFASPCCCCPCPPCVKSCTIPISNHPLNPTVLAPRYLTHLIRALLHAHLPLHLLHLLLLAERQRPRYAQQQRARTHHPQRLARQAEARGGVVVGGGGGVGDGFPVGRGDHVFERGEAVQERLVEVGGYGVGVGDVGFWGCVLGRWVCGGWRRARGDDVPLSVSQSSSSSFGPCWEVLYSSSSTSSNLTILDV